MDGENGSRAAEYFSNRKLQVFISSTYEDLKDARQKVMLTLLNHDCIPSGMEQFPSADVPQWSFCQSAIDACDCYLLIIGWLYGSYIDEESRKSYTWAEYEYALQQKKPVLAFLLEESVGPPQKVWETIKAHPEDQVLLMEFKKAAKNGRTVNFWSNLDDLASKIGKSLGLLKRDKTVHGWVRYECVEECEREIAQLKNENESRRRRLDALLSERGGREDLAVTQYRLASMLHARQQGDDLAEAENLYRKALDELPDTCEEIRGQACNDYASLLHFLGRDLKEADKRYRESLEIRKRLMKTHPFDRSRKRDYAHTCHEYALLLKSMGKNETAADRLEEAKEYREELEDDGESGLHEYAKTCYELATAKHELKKWGGALDEYQNALDAYRRLDEQYGASNAAMLEMARTCLHYAQLRGRKHKSAQEGSKPDKYAEKLCLEAIRIATGLAWDGGDDGTKAFLGEAHHAMGALYHGSDFAVASEHYQEALNCFRRIPQTELDRCAYEYGQSANDYAALLWEKSHSESGKDEKKQMLNDAAILFQAALTIREALLARVDKGSPKYLAFKTDLAWTCGLMALCMNELGFEAETWKLFERASQLRRELRDEDFDNEVIHRSELKETLKKFEGFLREAGHPEEADAVRREIDELSRFIP